MHTRTFKALRHLSLALTLLATACSSTSIPSQGTHFAYAGGVGGTGISPGGIGGTGITPGGIGGTGITGYGMVQGFGSVFVNGKEFFLDPASRITVNGRPGSEKDLHVGDVVSLDAIQDPRAKRYTALHIETGYQLQGLVDAVDPDHGTLRLLGQSIQIGPYTHIQEGRSASSLSLTGVRPGDLVAVSGLARGDGQWVATRLMRIAPAASRLPNPVFILRGPLQVSPNGTVRIGGQAVTLDGNLLKILKPGTHVVVSGHDQNGVLVTTQVAPERVLIGKAGNRVEMQGYLSKQPGTRQWTSNSIPLHRLSATSGMSPGTLVRIRGVLQADGSIDVERVEINALGLQELKGKAHPHGNGSYDTYMQEKNRDESRYRNAERRYAEQRPDTQRPEMQRPEVQRPEVQRPDIQRPDVQRPDMQRPEVQIPNAYY